MKWLLLFLVLLVGCSTASPRSMRRQADTLDQQAEALRQDASELEQAEQQARIQATADWAVYLTASAPTATPIPTETPTPLPTLTEPPTWTPMPATATPTATSAPEPSSTPQVEATQVVAVESGQGGDVMMLVVLAVAIIAFIWVAWPWIKRLMKW